MQEFAFATRGVSSSIWHHFSSSCHKTQGKWLVWEAAMALLWVPLG